MNEDYYEELGRNVILFKLNNYENPIDLSSPRYTIKFERTGIKKMNVYLINEQNDSILASEMQFKIEDLQKIIRKKNGIIRESIDGLVDNAYINFTYESIKMNLYKVMSSVMEQWFDTEYFRDDEEYSYSFNDVPIDDSMVEEAERILSSENPITEIEKHLDNIIAGEERNKLFVFVLALSGKMNDKKKKTIICALQEAGAGKTWLLQNIASFYNTEIASHLTNRALNYMGDKLREKEILFIKELGNLDKENNTSGNASIKMLSVDDGGLSTTYTIRKDDGTFDTVTEVTDPITIMTSSTRKSIDNQFVRRYWVFSPDASIEQTRKIRKFKEKMNIQEEQVTMGIRKYTDCDYSRGVLKHLVGIIPTDINILVPFWNSVYSIMDENNLRMRGDYDKVKLLIYLFGVLNYRNLPMIKKEVNGTEKIYHVMTPQRTIDILRIARDSLVFMAKGTEGRDYALLTALKDLNVRSVSDEYSGDEIGRELIYNISRKLGWSVYRVKNTMNKFADLGFMYVTNKPKVYLLNRPVEAIEGDLSGYPELNNEEELEKLYNRMVEEGEKTLEQYYNINYNLGGMVYNHVKFK